MSSPEQQTKEQLVSKITALKRCLAGYETCIADSTAVLQKTLNEAKNTRPYPECFNTEKVKALIFNREQPEALWTAFNWASTEQGYKYWHSRATGNTALTDTDIIILQSWLVNQLEVANRLQEACEKDTRLKNEEMRQKINSLLYNIKSYEEAAATTQHKLEEAEAALKQLYAPYPEAFKPAVVKEILAAPGHHDNYSLLYRAFSWCSTPQGNEYWQRRCKGKEPISDKDIIQLQTWLIAYLEADKNNQKHS